MSLTEDALPAGSAPRAQPVSPVMQIAPPPREPVQLIKSFQVHALWPDVAPAVHRLADSFVNWYLIEEGRGLTVVDAGFPTSWETLRRAVAALGRTLDDVKAVILTHAHFDHVGFAERARYDLQIPVYVHEQDEPLSRHSLRYRNERSVLFYAFNRSGARVIASSLWNGLAEIRGLQRVRVFRDGDTLDVPGAPRAVFTPGHTDGHCAFHLIDRDTIISGDALVTSEPYTGRPGPGLAARAANSDSRRALESLARLRETGAQMVLPGHGDPWYDGVEDAVRLARAAGAP